jgi:DNA polymerase (family 10)
LIISTDAHEAEQLLYMKYGIDDARRGWCEKKDIVNTLEFGEFCRALGVRNW